MCTNCIFFIHRTQLEEDLDNGDLASEYYKELCNYLLVNDLDEKGVDGAHV